MKTNKFSLPEFYNSAMNREMAPDEFYKQLDTYATVVSIAVCKRLADPQRTGKKSDGTSDNQLYSSAYHRMRLGILKDNGMMQIRRNGDIIEYRPLPFTECFSDGFDIKQSAFLAILEVLQEYERQGLAVDFDNEIVVRKPKRRVIHDLREATFIDVKTTGIKEIFRRVNKAARKSFVAEAGSKYNYIDQFVYDDDGVNCDTFYRRVGACSALNGTPIDFNGNEKYYLPSEADLEMYDRLLDTLAASRREKRVLQMITDGCSIEYIADKLDETVKTILRLLDRVRDRVVNLDDFKDKLRENREADMLFYEIEANYGFPKHVKFIEMTSEQRRNYKTKVLEFWRTLDRPTKSRFWRENGGNAEIIYKYGGVRRDARKREERKR